MLPFSMRCKEVGDSLYQLADGRFQLVADGPIAPLMVGFDYVLAEQALADFLASRSLRDLSFRRAIILRRRTGEQYDTHQQVLIGRRFEPHEIDKLELIGEQLFLMGARYVFVTPDLKRTLESANFRYLEFSEGLSEFAASA